MANEILNSLLKEYEQKKLKAELDLEKRKEQIYVLIPRLKEIDDELHSLGISTAKNILDNSNNSSNNSIFIENLEKKISLLKKEKENILLENNYNLSIFTPSYECLKCKDTGYIMQDDFTTNMCQCLKQKLLNISFNKSNMYNLDQQNFSTFDETIFSDEVDLSKYKFNTSPRKNILKIKEKCENFINNFDDINTKNLLFVGSTGLR